MSTKHYKCSMCGEEIEHEPHPTIASCPKCGRRGSFAKITATDTPTDTPTDPPVTDPPVDNPPVTDPPVDNPPVTDPPVQ